jgi:Icc-related predicted phosphoesterase
MKLLAFSDVHSDLEACERLVKIALEHKVEVAVGAGDFATMRRNLQPVIDVLAQMACPMVVVPGNGESIEELRAACVQFPQISVLHGDSVTIADQCFFGMGYAVPETPFGAWSCDLSEASADELLGNCPPTAILVSHSPPLGLVDRNSRGQHVGSQSILTAIQRTSPKLVLCGHVHDCWHQTSCIGTTSVHNLGPTGWLLEVF